LSAENKKNSFNIFIWLPTLLSIGGRIIPHTHPSPPQLWPYFHLLPCILNRFPHLRYNTSPSSFVFKNVFNSATVTWDCVTKYKDLRVRGAKLLSSAYLCLLYCYIRPVCTFLKFTELKCHKVHGAGEKMRPKLIIWQHYWIHIEENNINLILPPFRCLLV
jgi:hypothetical protein